MRPNGKVRTDKRAATFQIVATVVVIIAAFMLILILSIQKVKYDQIAIQENAKQYNKVLAKKDPDFAQKGIEQATYQGMYELGKHGGYTKDMVGTVENRDIFDGDTVSVWTEPQWIGKGQTPSSPYDRWATGETLRFTADHAIPEFNSNLEDVINEHFLPYLPAYISRYPSEMSEYEVQSNEVIEEGRRLENSYIQVKMTGTGAEEKEYTSNNKVNINSSTEAQTQTDIRVRLPDLRKISEELAKRIPHHVRWASGELLQSRISPSPNAIPDAGNTPGIEDWSETTGGKTEYWCTGIPPCGSSTGYTSDGRYYCTNCPNLESVTAPNYKACPSANVPVTEASFTNAIVPAVKWLDQWLKDGTRGEEDYRQEGNGQENYLSKIGYPPYQRERYEEHETVIAKSYGEWAFQVDLKSTETGDLDDLMVNWSPTDDKYTVLWWNQTDDGQAYRADGTNLVNDDWTEWDNWDKGDLREPGDAACDSADEQDCHTVVTGWCAEYKKQKTGSSSHCPSITSECLERKTSASDWCEEGSTVNDPPGHIRDCDDNAWTLTEKYYTAYCKEYERKYCRVSPYSGNPVCNACGSTDTHNFGNPPGGWVDCDSCADWECTLHNETTTGTGLRDFDTDETEGGHTTEITHCDMDYEMDAHFRYRAEVEVLTMLTDKSILIPVNNSIGNTELVNPLIKWVQDVVIPEEPVCGDGCCDAEAGEGLEDSVYWCLADCGPQIFSHYHSVTGDPVYVYGAHTSRNCTAIRKNTDAPNADYYG